MKALDEVYHLPITLLQTIIQEGLEIVTCRGRMVAKWVTEETVQIRRANSMGLAAVQASREALALLRLRPRLRLPWAGVAATFRLRRLGSSRRVADANNPGPVDGHEVEGRLSGG